MQHTLQRKSQHTLQHTLQHSTTHTCTHMRSTGPWTSQVAETVPYVLPANFDNNVSLRVCVSMFLCVCVTCRNCSACQSNKFRHQWTSMPVCMCYSQKLFCMSFWQVSSFMCVCVSVCLCVCVTFRNCSVCPSGRFRHLYMSVCASVCMCVCVYVCMCVCVSFRNCSAYSSGRLRHQRMSVSVYVSMCMCACVSV